MHLRIWLVGALFIGQALAHPLQSGLEAALAHYQTLAMDPAIQAPWREPLPPLGARKLAPGKTWSGTPLLVRRLAALGDLPAEFQVPTRYDGPLVAAVESFQRRHGLEADGVIGKETLAALNVPPATRLRQIELNLARVRQLPIAPRFLLVNVPEFVLRAYLRNEEKLRMKIIVGSSRNETPTPLFVEEMRYIEFRPYWNVPPSIARKELVPRLRREPGYFNAEEFEFHDGHGGTHSALTEENLAAVLQGRLQLRQRPGPKTPSAASSLPFRTTTTSTCTIHPLYACSPRRAAISAMAASVSRTLSPWPASCSMKSRPGTRHASSKPCIRAQPASLGCRSPSPSSSPI
jgi:murein L,D-transpeptidase YcbB/YkuD